MKPVAGRQSPVVSHEKFFEYLFVEGGGSDRLAERADALLTTFWQSLAMGDGADHFEEVILDWLIEWNTRVAVNSADMIARHDLSADIRALEESAVRQSQGIAEVLRRALDEIRLINAASKSAGGAV